MTHQRAGAIENVERDLSFGLSSQEITNDGACRWIVTYGTATIDAFREVETTHRSGFIEDEIRAGDLWTQITQWRDVVQYPKRATIGGKGQVVVVNGEVGHRRAREVQLYRLPLTTIIERDIRSEVGP